MIRSKLIRTTKPVYALPEELYTGVLPPPSDDLVLLPEDSVGRIIEQYRSNNTILVTVVMFPGYLRADLGPTAWISEDEE